MTTLLGVFVAHLRAHADGDYLAVPELAMYLDGDPLDAHWHADPRCTAFADAAARSGAAPVLMPVEMLRVVCDPAPSNHRRPWLGWPVCETGCRPAAEAAALRKSLQLYPRLEQLRGWLINADCARDPDGSPDGDDPDDIADLASAVGSLLAASVELEAALRTAPWECVPQQVRVWCAEELDRCRAVIAHGRQTVAAHTADVPKHWVRLSPGAWRGTGSGRSLLCAVGGYTRQGDGTSSDRLTGLIAAIPADLADELSRAGDATVHGRVQPADTRMVGHLARRFIDQCGGTGPLQRPERALAAARAVLTNSELTHS